MTNEQLCALALAAIDDVEARVVLDDAMEETAWWDDRCWTAMGWPWAASMWPGQEPFMSNAAWLTDKGPRAIAAVLLFGSWPTSWPLAERCSNGMRLIYNARTGERRHPFLDVGWSVASPTQDDD